MYLLTSSVSEYNILVVAAYKVKASRVYVKKSGHKGIALLSKTSVHFEHLVYPNCFNIFFPAKNTILAVARLCTKYCSLYLATRSTFSF